jgi:hypothetical protein
VTRIVPKATGWYLDKRDSKHCTEQFIILSLMQLFAARCTLTPDRWVARLPSGAGSAARELSRGIRKGATQAPLELLSFVKLGTVEKYSQLSSHCRS